MQSGEYCFVLTMDFPTYGTTTTCSFWGEITVREELSRLEVTKEVIEIGMERMREKALVQRIQVPRQEPIIRFLSIEPM